RAQSTGGRIRGTVIDPSGGAVPAANVALRNEATGSERTAQSGATGEYVFLEVSVGTYTVELQLTGFKKYVRKGITLELSQILTLDITLQLGGSTEVVEVTGAPPLVDTTSTQLGAVVGERAVSQLPLAQRDAYQLLQLQPGVQSQVGLDTVYGSDRAGVVSVNGGRGRDNNFTVNGGDGNDQFAGLPAIQPSPDAIAEFRVLTNTFDAEYGRNSGAVVNVVTKSGTNDWHGSAYEFFRDKNLNARGFFDTQKLDYLQNQFGATFGGPVKKDKTFFFVTYEGDRIRRGTSGDTVTVPTDLERTGDFSNGLAPTDPNFQGFTGTLANANILNDRPGCLTALGLSSPIADGTAYATVFPTNQIPTPCMDQTAFDLLNQFVPHANIGGSLFQGVPLGREHSDQFTMKIDHQLTKNQHVTGYYYLTNHYLAKPFARFQSGGSNIPGFGDLTDERIQQINISHTWTIGSTAVNEARFTLFREGQGTFLHPQHTNLVQTSCTSAVTNCFTDGTTANPTGIHPNLGASREGVPFVNISGGFNMGNNFEGELPQTGNTYQWSDNFSKTIGKHDLKFGGDVRYQRFDQTLYFAISGQYFYFGGGPNDPGFSNLFPNYLLGVPDEYGQGSAQSELVRSKSLYLFAQDSWKLKPTVTLNYGLRWELNTPLADSGKKVQTFRPGQRRRLSHGIGSSRRQRHSQRTFQPLLQILCPAHRPCLEPCVKGWLPRQVVRRLWKDQHSSRLRHFLQSCRTTRAGTVQRRAAVRWQHIRFQHAIQHTFPESGWKYELPQPIQRDSESRARAAAGLVRVPSNFTLRPGGQESEDAVRGTVQSDDSTRSSERSGVAIGLCRPARASAARITGFESGQSEHLPRSSGNFCFLCTDACRWGYCQSEQRRYTERRLCLWSVFCGHGVQSPSRLNSRRIHIAFTLRVREQRWDRQSGDYATGSPTLFFSLMPANHGGRLPAGFDSRVLKHLHAEYACELLL
ncbi:MAG: TonB-dependent receptor, partial [Acidobacteria bacterium]|nr:TonB-dependent receptor [Acidobacteriota bacterium]